MSRVRAKVVIWDLDETLCHSCFYPEGMDEAEKHTDAEERFYKFRLHDTKPGRDGTYGTSMVWGTLRENARDVIEGLSRAGFRQAVWSAGEREYVHAVVDAIFRPTHVKPIAILTRDDCETIYGGGKPVTVKNLRLLWNENPAVFSPSNTIIVDNRDDVCMFNGNNHIKIPDYEHHKDDRYPQDDALWQIYNHLIRNRNAQDVRLITSVKVKG